MRNVYEEIYRKVGAIRDCEPVPGDFLIKKTGAEIISRFFDLSNHGSILEVGCGSGVNTAFLSGSAKSVIATDLPDYDSTTHSLGIAVAKRLLERVDVKNAEIVSCSGEVLPFRDNTFDLVFSSSVLEHIDDKESALKEMLRVVKPGGAVLFVIPTYVQSICAFVHLPLYMGKRILEVAHMKVFKRPLTATRTLLPTKSDSARANSAILDSFMKSHPDLPFPQPHGSYKNVFQEFSRQLPWRWTRLARKCGARKVETFAFLFFPFNIMEVFSTRLIAFLYTRTKRLHCLIAQSPLKYFCYSYCVIAKK